MSCLSASPFEHAIHTTNAWLHDLMDELNCQDKRDAYRALRAVLHALRDRLPVAEAAALGAQLPMLVRGFYYERWHPGGKPVKERKKEEFLAHVAAELRETVAADPETVTRAVFRVLRRRISAGEIEGIEHLLPAEIRSLWAPEMETIWS